MLRVVTLSRGLSPPSSGFRRLRGGGMNQTGQPSYALFAGNDSSNLKTFVLEVDCYRTEDALLAMEKAISELKICQRQFGYGNDSGVRAIIR